MAAWAEGHTDRFSTIIDHAGVNDFITQYGADATTYSFSKVLGGTPWSDPEGMRKNDPMTYAKNFKTPMLILHGEQDYRVPYVNGTALYGVLQAMGVPSRLVIFPQRESLGPQFAERHPLELGGAELAGTLHRWQTHLGKPVFETVEGK
ncbi:MAG: prolyl oligopeptidase family serine peptidase [Flavobacteriales bacterium]|nr:prolyl oligopeptidase family serine peptidase [Flavobacteriales bacterium]